MRTLWPVFAVVLFIGCAREEPKLELFPVSGRVTLKGKPLAGAELCFFGLDESLQVAHAPFPEAVSEADGNFIVSSYNGDPGAPAGKYRVTLVCRQSESVDPESRELAVDVFGGKYDDPDASPLTVEIVAGANQLSDFEF